MKEDDIFASLFKKRFNEIDEHPTNDVWENISKELDVNDMWSNIDTQLTTVANHKSNNRKLIWGISFLTLLITSASIYFYNNSLPQNKAILAFITPSKFEIKPKVFKEKNSNTNLEFKNSDSQDFNQQEKIQNYEVINNKIDSITTYNYNNNADPKLNIELAINNSIIKKDITINDSILKIDTLNTLKNKVEFNNFDSNKLITKNLDSNQVMIPNKKSEFVGIYLGGVYSFNNTWLLNNSTFDGFKSNSLNQTNISINNTFGLAVGYNYNEYWGAELSGYCHSPQNQTYYLYSEGKYQKKEVNLNYTILSLAVKYRNSSNNNWLNSPSSNNIVLGFNYGILNDANQVIGTKASQLDSYFHKNDYGFRLGYEYELLFIDRILVSLGIYSDTGLKNVFKGNNSNPGNFNRTHTEALRLNLGVKYLIKR